MEKGKQASHGPTMLIELMYYYYTEETESSVKFWIRRTQESESSES